MRLTRFFGFPLLSTFLMLSACGQGGSVTHNAAIVGEAAVVGTWSIVEGVGQRAASSVDLFTNEDTVQATRAELDAMASATLHQLLTTHPETVPMFQQSAGYAVFDGRKLVVGSAAAGAGRGVAVPRRGGRPTYMRAGTAGLEVSLGYGMSDARVVFLFETEPDFTRFVTGGYGGAIEGGTILDDLDITLDFKFVDGRAIFFVTDNGWNTLPHAAGTKYWVDSKLN